MKLYPIAQLRYVVRPTDDGKRIKVLQQRYVTLAGRTEKTADGYETIYDKSEWRDVPTEAE